MPHLSKFPPDLTSRRGQEYMRRRRATLTSSRSTFADYGYDGATLDEIARRAEFGKGTLYNYFESKEQLLLVLYADAPETLAAPALQLSTDIIAGADVRAALVRYFTATLTYLLSDPYVYPFLRRVGHHLVTSGRGAPASLCWLLQERLLHQLAPAMEATVARGAFVAVPSRVAAMLVLSAVGAYLQADCYRPTGDQPRLEQKEVPSPAEAGQFLASLLMGGLASSRLNPGASARTPSPAGRPTAP